MFIQDPRTARRLTNFFVLLLLATVIATFGMLADSTATIIGAMIVAPLMGPIMATRLGVAEWRLVDPACETVVFAGRPPRFRTSISG